MPNNWVSDLEDYLLLNGIAVPGSHDSCTAVLDDGSFGKTQSLTIAEQLDIGVRFFDLRAAYSASAPHLPLYHGKDSLKTDLETVLNQLNSFLTAPENNRELIIVSIKPEYYINPGRKTLVAFEGAVYHLLKKLTTVYWGNDCPTVGSLRGKLVIFRRWNALPGHEVGIDASSGWVSNSTFEIEGTCPLWVQDYWDVNLTATLTQLVAKKLGEVSDLCGKAVSSAGVGHLFVNFLSVSWEFLLNGINTPENIANGHNGVAGVNAGYKQLISTTYNESLPGIAVADFIDQNLVDYVLSGNPR